jgi:zinc transport system permease protein
MIVVLPVTVICAVLLLRRGSHSQIKGDAAIAMLSAGALAFGYLLTNRFAGPSNIAGDVCTTLFGSMSILTLDFTDVVVCSVLAVAVIAVFVIFYNRIFARRTLCARVHN